MAGGAQNRMVIVGGGGNVKVFGVRKTGKVVALFSIPLPPTKAPGRSDELSAGVARLRSDIEAQLAMVETSGDGDEDGAAALDNQIAAKLKAKGVVFTREPNTPRPGIRVCFIRGPEGISIELLDRDKSYV